MKTNPAHLPFHRHYTAALIFLSLAGGCALKGANMTAQWNFDDSSNAGSSVSNVGGFVGTFVNVADRTVAGGGVSGTAGDFALDVRALGDAANGAMSSNTPAFLSALNSVTGSQAMSLTYWEFLDSTPVSYALFGNSPSAVGGVPGQRGLSAHSPWVDGNLYFDTSGCCDPNTRISGPMGATLGE